MSRLFAVVRSLGAGWNDAVGLEEQAGWRTHADFMNQLHAEGAVVLGGPLEGTREVLLIMCGSDAAEIAARWRAIRGAGRTCCGSAGLRHGRCGWAR